MTFARLRAALSRETWAAALLGGLYGVGMRLLFDAHFDGFELFSRSFFIGMPVGIGALTMWLALRRGLGAWAGIRGLLLAVLVFIGICMATGLEGTICIVLLMPVLIVVPLLGSLAAYVAWRLTRGGGRATIPAIAVLPLLFAPIEARLPVDPTPFTVTDRIVIDAPPDRVWHELTHIGAIDPAELRPALVFAMGVPRPLRSDLPGTTPGTMRTSVWEKDVVFHERVTESRRAHVLAYRFEIDGRRIPARAFDEHVRLGGRYYALRDGAYRLRALPRGRTELSLSTTLSNTSRTGAYGRAWAHVVFSDFHGVLLDLIRDRSEHS